MRLDWSGLRLDSGVLRDGDHTSTALITLRAGVFVKLEVENPGQSPAPLLLRGLDELPLREETAGQHSLTSLRLHLKHRQWTGLVLRQPD